MRRSLLTLATLALALGPGAALAEPATPEGAKAMAAAYAAWFSPAAFEKGIIAIAPQGDDYVVTWDLAKLFATAPTPAAVAVSPWVYRVTPTLEGGWFAHASSLPSLSFAPAGAGDSGSLAFDGFRFDALFDPAAPDLLRAKLALGALKLDAQTKLGAKTQHFLLTQNGVAGEMRVRAGDSEGTIDVRMKQSVASTIESSSVNGDNGDQAQAIETRQGAAAGESVITGLRAQAFGDLWRFLVAHAQSEPPTGEQLKPMLAALAPLWTDLAGQVEVGDIAVTFPGGSVSLKSAGEDVTISGVAEHAKAALALAVKDLNIDLDAAPDWAKTIWPLTMAVQLEAGVDGLDRAVEIALADQQWLKSGVLGEDAKSGIVQTLISGQPHVTLSQTRLVTPLVEATFEGEARYGESGPQAHGKITADDLGKVLEAIAKITESEPNARQFLFLATFIRGLAKSEDGRLVWDLEFVPPNAVKVNGQLFPPK